MILTRKVPSQEELKNLCSWDLAFMALTGRVEWIDPFDALFFAQKAIRGHGSKEYLWGPEADLLSKTIVAAWKKVGTNHVKQIQAAFDLSGDISVSDAKLKKALASSKKLGKQMWLVCGKKVRAIVETTIERAQIHFERQRKEALKAVTEEAWTELMATANTDHVQAYMIQYPDRMLHPEVTRLAELTRMKPDARTIDKIQLRDRIGKIHGKGEQYFANMSDVQVGRTWTDTGIQMAHEQGVTEYMIISESDGKVCPVCRRLHGKHFPVEGAYNTMQQGMKTKDPDKLNKLFKFPRVAQLDNKSPKQIRGMNLRPVFHGKCRCDVQFLWRQVAVPTAAIPTKADVLGWEKGSDAFEAFLTRGEKEAPSALKRYVEERLRVRLSKAAGKADYDYFCENWWHDRPAFGNEGALIRNWACSSADNDPLALLLQKAAQEEFGLSTATTKHFSLTGRRKLEALLKGKDAARIVKGARVFVREMYNETQATFKAAGIKEMTLFRGSALKDVGFDVKKASAAKKKKLDAALLKAEARVAKLKALPKLSKDKWDAALDTLYAIKRELRDLEELRTVVAGITEMGTQPMSSFSTDLRTALSFLHGSEESLQSITTLKVPVDRILSCPRTGFGYLGETEVVVLGGVDDVAIATVERNVRSSLQDWIKALLEVLE